MMKILLNPFEKIAGLQSLVLGVAVILVTGIISYFANLHLDGILDAHFSNKQVPAIIQLSEGFINWILISVFLLISGAIFTKTNYRLIDVFGTQALARWPMIIIVLLSLISPHEKLIKYFEWKFEGKGNEVLLSTPDIILVFIHSIASLTVLVWLIVLMYRAYSISFNVKGTKGVLSFTIALIAAEVVSKYIYATAFELL